MAWHSAVFAVNSFGVCFSLILLAMLVIGEWVAASKLWYDLWKRHCAPSSGGTMCEVVVFIFSAVCALLLLAMLTIHVVNIRIVLW